MKQLNLPKVSNLSVEADPGGEGRMRIYDRMRGKWVALTPEEWVRQNFTSWLVEYKHYPISLMANEVGIKIQGMTRRIDTLVYGRDGRTPLCIVEFKAPEVMVCASTFMQAARYNLVMQAPVLIISNGMHHYAAEVTPGYPQPRYLKDIPTYEELELIARCRDDSMTG